MQSDASPLYVSKVQLTNIKCFGQASLEIDHGGQGAPWTVVVGDNASGKTALLRSLALGLCDESSAAGLMKESDEGYVRRGEQGGEIVIELVDKGSTDLFRITTTITRNTIDSMDFENLRKTTDPEEAFPWHRIFACAYGMGRATGGTGDVSGYSVINAVYNLFNYGEGLQNPELTILRIPDNQQRDYWLGQLAAFFDYESTAIRRTDRGITVTDPRWGEEMPLRDLADGYRATFLWVADFLGWALAFGHSTQSADAISGILLVDELEQHLHARWQRTIIASLRKLFPRVQFIVTTHSPFVATSIGDLSHPDANDTLVLTELAEDSSAVRLESLDTMQEYRFEQVLASRAFRYVIEANPELEAAIKRASELSDKGEQRTEAEDQEYDALKAKLKGTPFLRATSSVERDIERDELAELKRREEEFDRDDAQQEDGAND